jgi:hypothetical protein
LFSSTDHFNKWSKVNENAQIKKKTCWNVRKGFHTNAGLDHTHTHNATYHDFWFNRLTEQQSLLCFVCFVFFITCSSGSSILCII